MKRADGRYRWLLARAMPLKNDAGEITRWFGTCTDIHDQKIAAETLEDKVRERTKDLEEANKALTHLNSELQQFTYISSHDLQEPLRKVGVLTQMIEREDLAVLSESSKRNFKKIVESVTRMRNSLKDLIDYASLDRESQFTSLNLNDVVSGVLIDLEVLAEEKQAKINVDTLPTIRAIPMQMHQLFYNLLNNALKYSKQGVSAVINVRAQVVAPHQVPPALALNRGQQYVQIEVQDNGIGFDSKYSERIFSMFQRLHNRTEYSGTGIGLSLCKKVVVNHSGAIYADAVPGQGATFYILLPMDRL